MSHIVRGSLIAFAMSGALLAPACGGKPAPKPPEVVVDAAVEPVDAAPPPPKEIYEQLGGAEKVTSIVDAVVKGSTEDKKLTKSFAKVTGAKLEGFKKGMNDYLCALTKGGCTYDPKTTADAFKAMAFTQAQYDVFIGVLTNALRSNGATDEQLEKIMDGLAESKLHDEIVKKK